MSTCHDIGISGNCGLDCPVFLRGDCENVEPEYVEEADLDEEDKQELREAYGFEAPAEPVNEILELGFLLWLGGR